MAAGVEAVEVAEAKGDLRENLQAQELLDKHPKFKEHIRKLRHLKKNRDAKKRLFQKIVKLTVLKVSLKRISLHCLV